MMGNNNKILTVSYGTFSCTLEGFEDSFDTMKAIAEYFRDLAAEDRLFGAVPPTPDAAILATLAEKGSNQQVKVAASEEDGKIVLRATETTDAAPSMAAPAAATAIATTMASAAAGGEAGSIAERLQRIRAVVNKAQDAEDPEYSEDQHADEFATDANAAAPAEEADEEIYEEDLAVEEPAVEETAEAVTDEPEAEATEVEDEVKEAAADTAEDTVAEEAEGFEDEAPAPVEEVLVQEGAQADEDASEEPETSDDMIAAISEAAAEEEPVAEEEDEVEAEVETSDDDIEDTLSTLLAEQEADAEVEAETEAVAEAEVAEESDDKDADGDSTIAAMMAEFEADTINFSEAEAEQVEAPANDEAEDFAETDDLAEAEAEAETYPEVEAEVDAEDEVEAEVTADAEDEAEAEADVEVEADADASEEVSDADAEEAKEESDDTIAKVGPFALRNPLRRARVIKVKRSDFQKAMDDGVIEEVPAETAQEEDATVSSLSEQDEAELIADLAKVEAEEAGETELGQAGSDEIVETDAEETVAAEADEYEEEAAAQPAANFETDVNRLMAKADEAMDEPETAQRRSAFQALKAAVAARKADRDLAAEDEEKNDSVAYQSDLAEVVQPSAPEPTPERRQAPLRLVAEQRVDTDDEQPAEEPVAEDVQPRRPEPAAEETGSDFTAYAREKGATSLPDVLEAAAAYLAFVEGKEQFSRPQLMTKVRMVEKEDFSREEGLRSFGQLLRAGKIEKIAGGRFAVTAEIGYRPDQREAG